MVCSRKCDAKYKRVTNLQKTHCDERQAALSHVSYLAELTLPKDDHYTGHMVLRFDLDKDILPGDALRLDFKGHEINSIVINDLDVTESIVFDDHAIFLPKEQLLDDGNTVTVAYKNEYGHNGCGLHSYVDPEDGEQYVYTFFEAHYGHEVFPMFDQPNIKASCSLVLNAPETWTMIANEEAREVHTYSDRAEWKKALPNPILSEGEFRDGGIKRWSFLATPKMSTYLYAFCGGDYSYIQGPIGLVCPMKLYYRKSVAKWITEEYAAEWFAASDHSTRFFEKYMNVAYPYSKMDHIIVPEFNMGAMEQTGCITYTEKYLFKVPPSRSRRINVTNTIMHEIAHQWFGNLITMNWWDDLWLNEAFATFMSCVAQECYTDTNGVRTGEEAWLYLVDDTVWGLKEDQEKETHPIACTAKDTVEAENIFDGISYGKGSSFLKTWSHYVGPDKFRDGVRDYFSRYMQSNASLCHFVRTQDEASDIAITEWAYTWLKTKGAMQVSLDYNVDSDNTITSFSVVQSFCPNADETFKSHKMDIAMFYTVGDRLEKKTVTLLVEASGRTVVAELVGQKAPGAFLVNSTNHVYCKAVNDVASTNFLLEHYHQMTEVLDRYCFIVGLVYQIRDGKYPALKYLSTFESSLISEEVQFLKEAYIKFALEFIESVASDQYEHYVMKLYHVLKKDLNLRVAEANARRVDPCYGECVTSLTSSVLSLLDRSTALLETEGQAILTTQCIGELGLQDCHLRTILPEVVSLKCLDLKTRTELIESVLGPMGNSSDVQSCRRACEASVPTMDNKEAIFSKLINPPKGLSQEAYGDYASYFCSQRQPDLMLPFVDRYYENALLIHTTQSHFLAEKFFFHCSPSNALREESTYVERFMTLSEGGDQMFKTNVAKIVDRDTRRIENRKLTNKSDW